MTNKNQEQHSTRVIIVLSVIVVLLIGVLIASICMEGFTNPDPFGLFAKDEDPSISGGGMVVDPDDSNAKIMTLSVSPTQAISATNNSVQITATVKPENASQEVDWSVKFYGTYSWSSDKNVSDYVIVIPDSDGSTRATIRCLQAFGDKIKVTCTARDDNSKQAYCTLDYMNKVSVSLNSKIPTSFTNYSNYKDAYFVGELDSVGTISCAAVYIRTNFFNLIEDIFDLPESSVSSKFEGRYNNIHVDRSQIGTYKPEYLEPYFLARATGQNNVLYVSEDMLSNSECSGETWWLCWKFWYDALVSGSPSTSDINKFIENYNSIAPDSIYVDFCFALDSLGEDIPVKTRFILHFPHCGKVTPYRSI